MLIQAVSDPIKRVLRATRFGQENALILQEFRYFPWIAAVGFALLAVLFEEFGFGFLMAFLQSLISSTVAAYETGLYWFDIWIFGIKLELQSQLNHDS